MIKRLAMVVLGCLLLMGLVAAPAALGYPDRGHAWVPLDPVITGLTPDHGPPGGAVTITGVFHSAPDPGVWFGTTAATITSWSTNSIGCAVPALAPGVTAVTVVQSGRRSAARTFTVEQPGPRITSITPGHAVPQELVTVNGSGFGASRGAITVSGGKMACEVVRWSDTSIDFKAIFYWSEPGAATLAVTVGGLSSNSMPFTLDPWPHFSGVSPYKATRGDVVTISGWGFGASQGTESAGFKQGQSKWTAVITSWSDTKIVCTVPPLPAGDTVVWVTAHSFAFGIGDSFVVVPGVESVTPSHAPAGAALTIAGSAFGDTQGASTVKLGSTAAAVTSWSDLKIVCVVPTMAPGATTVAVNVGGWSEVTSSAVPFTVDPPAPQITGLTPDHGLPGAAVTIAGNNFGASKGASSVTFGTTIAAITSWSDTSIQCAVPAAAASGATSVTVTVGSQTSNALAFTVDAPAGAPQITGLAPNHGLPGASVIISGNGFGVVQGASSVRFGSTVAAVTSWSATSIACSVPVMTPGATTVAVTVAGLASNAMPFTVDGAVVEPQITSLAPNHGQPGAGVVITGSGFGATQGISVVKFGTTVATVTSWSATSIACSVPAKSSGASTVTVTVAGQASNIVAFTVDGTAGAPQVSGVTPDHALPGTTVVVSGSGFGATKGAGIVRFGTTVASITSWSDTRIACRVPIMAQGATTVAVVTAGGLASNAMPFTVESATVKLALKGLHARTVSLGRRVTATCTVAPSGLAGGSAWITVLKKTGSHWKRVAFTQWTVGASGVHRWTWKPTARGSYRMTARIMTDYLRVDSPMRPFKVR